MVTVERAALCGILSGSSAPGVPKSLKPKRLLAVAHPHVRPLLRERLRSDPELGWLERQVGPALDEDVRGATMAYLQQRAVLTRAVRALSARGLPVALLKGAALAHTVYPSPELRPMADIDLWIPAESLDEAARCLTGAGLRYPTRVLPEGKRLPELSVRCLEAPGTAVLVEVHGHVQTLQLLDAGRIQRCWDRAEPVTVGAITAMALSPEDSVLHVGLHAAAIHRFSAGLVPLVDLTLMLARWHDRFDWDAMCADYREQRIAVWMYLAFTLARDLFQARVPDRVVQYLRPPSRGDEMRSLAVEQLWGADYRIFGGLDRVFQAGTLAGSGRAIFRRLASHYWRSDVGEARTLMRAFRDASGRLVTDLRVKVPKYVSAWRSGALSGPRFRRKRELARSRGSLAKLVADAERESSARESASAAGRLGDG